MFSSARQTILPLNPVTYTFSGARFGNFLADYHGPPETPIKILLLSHGDLPVRIQALLQSPDQSITELTLTDASPLVVARNVLFAKIISEDSYDPSNLADLEYVWDVWYNTEWPSSTLQRFLKDVKELDASNLLNNVKVPLIDDQKNLQTIWNNWVSIASKMDLSMLEKARSERYESIIKQIHGIMRPDVPLPDTCVKPKLAEVWKWIDNAISQMDLSHLPDFHRKAISEEMRIYFETGVNSLNKKILVGINPTLLDLSTGQLALSCLVSPFENYLNLMEVNIEDSLLLACLRSTGDQVVYYRKQLKNVSFFIGEPLDLCHRRVWSNIYDIIDCSALPDRSGLANILIATMPLLANDDKAILLTESAPWTNSRLFSAKEFVEESLGTCLSMIPTLYGLTLIDHVNLGTVIPLKGNRRSSIQFRWKKCPNYSNICVGISGAIGDFIEEFKSRCFAGSEVRPTEITETFTPLTYGYFIDSLSSRINLDQSLEQPTRSAPFQLAWNTIRALLNGGNYLKLTVCLTPMNKQPGPMRLVLASYSQSRVHYIDNVELSKLDNNITASFILTEDHQLNLDEAVVYLSRGTASIPITSPIPLKDALIKSVPEKRIFSRKTHSAEVLTCIEFAEFYHIDLPGIQQKDISLSTDKKYPSEAGHELTLTANESVYSIVVPWPFEVAGLHSSESDEGNVYLILPKALHEPHPFEWNYQKRWDGLTLPIWDTQSLIKDLNFHLSAQFEFADLKRQMLATPETEMNGSALRGVREIIRTLFQSTVLDNNLQFVILSIAFRSIIVSSLLAVTNGDPRSSLPFQLAVFFLLCRIQLL